jgi:hypothetical protein
MPATHTHSAATHTHGAAAKMSSAPTPTEVSTAAATTTKVTAAASAAKMSTATTAAAETAASRVSSRRQTKGNGYCGRACRNFPHNTPHRGRMQKPTPDRPVRSGVMLQCTRRPVRVTQMEVCVN